MMNLPNLFQQWQLLIFMALATITIVQLFYYLFFFSRLAFYRSKSKTTSQSHPVSVIICARDEAENLTINLPGTLEQDYPTTYEVIVVNDNSYDESKYILEELKKTFRQMLVVELTQEAKMIPGKKFPLSIGIKTAKHEIVLLTDADCVPASEHWIESMQSVYDDKTEIVLGYGAYHKRKGLLNKVIRWDTFHAAMQYMSFALAGIAYMGVGRNLSYKKIIFYRHKGFSAHNNIPGGDDDLFINMAATNKNTKINIDRNSFTMSKGATTWRQWKAQKQRHYSTSRFYRPLHKFLLGIYAISQFAFYPLLFASFIFYDWQYALLLFAIKFFIQAIIYARVLKKLGEQDLFPLFLFFDIWMFFYYIVFAPALVKKIKPTWK